jgi:error-prone DNA polymerase
LVARAAELRYAALAITDRHSLAGVVRAHVAAKEAGLKLLIGAEIVPQDAPPVVLWASDRASYGRLASLITQGCRRAEKGQCHLTFADVADYAEGLLAGVLPEPQFQRSLARWLNQYRGVFGDRTYLLAELHRGPDDEKRLDRLVSLSRRTHVPLIAAGGVRYHVPERQALLDVLTAVRLGTTVAGAGEHLFANAERYLKPPEAMAYQFARVPEAIRRTVEIAERCTFSLDELRYEYPEELAPQGQTPIEYLVRLTWAGAKKRYPAGVPAKVQQLLEHELRLIGELRYEAYFLTVWDLVRFARSRGILCQGRGSAANSAVCYCLGVTAVDPDRTDVLFERFVSRERNEAPDIDVDFEHERREEVLQYLYEKYGRDRAGMTAEVITYRPRSAVRDVGKALGLSLDRVDALAKRLEPYRMEPHLDQRCREAGIDPESSLGRQLVELVNQLLGFPRHLSQHTGGMVMTRGLLRELVPIENAAMPDRTVIQWNKDDLDELGILKVDCLALGMLTAIRKCFDLVERHHGQRLTLANIPEGDPDVYAMIRRADTMGVFQIESRAQMSMLPRLRPRTFYDLVIEVAIVRPGPIQGNMVHPYLRRRNGEEQVTYPNEAIRGVLEKTLGVPLFQEQAMRLAIVAAGFTPGEADQLRRAMGAWRRPGLIDQFRKKLIDGMLASGMSLQYAEATFHQIRGFGDYGFPESHAASFALLVYVSAWLKHHYPAAFCAALLNSQPMGFYAPAQLVRDARQHGVEVRPVDVNESDWESTLEQGSGIGEQGSGGREQGSGFRAQEADAACHAHAGVSMPTLLRNVGMAPKIAALRLGFHMLQGMGEMQARRIQERRGNEPFVSMDDFARRTGLSRAVIMRLSKGGAFESMKLNRRIALWHSLAQDQKSLPLFDQLKPAADEPAALPAMSAAEEVLADYRTAGLSLKAHPMSFLREQLQGQKVVQAQELCTWPNGHPVRVAGIVLVRQRPGTAKGITFVTLEDETGIANLIIRPDVWQRWRQAAFGATILLAHGRLQRHGQVIHVLCTKLENLSEQLKQLASRSRDFC